MTHKISKREREFQLSCFVEVNNVAIVHEHISWEKIEESRKTPYAYGCSKCCFRDEHCYKLMEKMIAPCEYDGIMGCTTYFIRL